MDIISFSILSVVVGSALILFIRMYHDHEKQRLESEKQ